MRTLICCVVGMLFISVTEASSFKKFKTTNLFDKYFGNQITTKSISNIDLVKEKSEINKLIISNLLKTNNLGKRSNVSESSSSGDLDNIYDAIEDQLDDFEAIGNEKVNALLKFNLDFDLGQTNYPGVTWQKPVGNIVIGVDRQVVPDYSGENKWIVQDRFIFSIEASTFLQSLDQSGVIEISEGDLGVFAGMQYLREYKHYHFADSYQDGLKKDFIKLFKTFLLFKNTALVDLGPQEFISKRELILAQAGGGGNIQTPYFISIGAAFLAGIESVSQVEVYKTGNEKTAQEVDNLRLNFKKNKKVIVKASGNIGLDFYNILKLTLFSFEVEYNHSEEYEKSYEFDHSLFNQLANKKSKIGKDFKRALTFRKPSDYLDRYIVAHSIKYLNEYGLNYKALFFGGLEEAKTEYVTIDTEDHSEEFFIHRFFNKKYIKSPLFELLNGFTQGILGLNLFEKYLSLRTRKTAYEYYGNQAITNIKSPVVENNDEISISIEHSYFAQNTKGIFNRSFKKYVMHFLKEFTTVENDVIEAFSTNFLMKNVELSSKTIVTEDALKHFHKLGSFIAEARINKMCDQNYKWPKRNTCKSTLVKRFKKYFESLKGLKVISLKHLKNFIEKLVYYSDSTNDLRQFFGNNLFISGKVAAKTKSNSSFQTFFDDGDFKGLGVIDDYKNKLVPSRSPASVIP